MTPRILFVCHGNICRSPMAEFIMRHMAAERGVPVEVESCATSDEEIGNTLYPPARRVLEKHGVPFTERCARRMTREDYSRFDSIFVMDRRNLTNIRPFSGDDPDGKVSLLMGCAGEGRDISDPWYTGDFERTYSDISEACSALLDRLSGA